MYARAIALALAGVLAPTVLIACGGGDKVTREEAAPCVKALEAWWPDANMVNDVSGTDQEEVAARVRKAAAQIRAACDPRTLPVALQDTRMTEIGETKVTLEAFCNGDPYRESQLCKDMPQASS